MELYLWTRRHFERNSKRGKWIPTWSDTLFITPEWYEVKTGKAELDFFRSLGRVVCRDSYDGISVTLYSPDGMQKSEESFKLVRIPDSMLGFREREAIGWSLDPANCVRCIPADESGPGFVVRFGDRRPGNTNVCDLLFEGRRGFTRVVA